MDASSLFNIRDPSFCRPGLKYLQLTQTRTAYEKFHELRRLEPVDSRLDISWKYLFISQRCGHRDISPYRRGSTDVDRGTLLLDFDADFRRANAQHIQRMDTSILVRFADRRNSLRNDRLGATVN